MSWLPGVLSFIGARGSAKHKGLRTLTAGVAWQRSTSCRLGAEGRRPTG